MNKLMFRTIPILFFAVLTLSTAAYAQELTELTLSDAILKQGTSLGPEKLSGLMWLDETSYVFNREVDGSKFIYRYDLKTGTESEFLSLENFNKEMAVYNEDLNRFPRLTVKGKKQLVFQVNRRFFMYHLDSKKIEEYSNITEGASDFNFSENGLNLAYVVDNNIHVASVGGARRQITEDGENNIVYGKAVSRYEFGISKGIFWSPGGESIAYYRNDQSNVTNYPLVDLKTTPASENPIKYPMAGGPSEIISVELYHLKSKKRIKLKTGEGEDYICSVNWSPDGKQIILVTLNRDQNHAKYKLYDASTGNFEGDLYEEKDKKYVEPLFPLHFPGKNALNFIYLSQKDGYMHLYSRYNGKDQQLTKGNWVVQEVLGMNVKSDKIYVLGTGDRPTETSIYSVDLNAKGHKKISKGNGYHRAKINADQSYIIDYFSSTDVPGTVDIIDVQGKQMKNLLKSADPLKAHAVSRPEIYTIKNFDGKDLYARMIKPHDFDEKKKYPVVVYVYNGPHAQLIRNSWWASSPLWMNYFAEQGYLVFTVDGRGSANRGKDFEQSIFRNLSELEMQDQLAGVAHLKTLPYVDTTKLAVHGWSYGGFMTTSLMLKHPGVFEVGVAGGPVTNWKYYEVMYTERYMDDPESNPEGFKKTDLTNYVKGLEGDLLLIHGMSDDVVVPQHNLTLVKKFVDEGIQVDFFPYIGHPHNVRGKDRVHLMQKVLSYIEDHIE